MSAHICALAWCGSSRMDFEKYCAVMRKAVTAQKKLRQAPAPCPALDGPGRVPLRCWRSCDPSGSVPDVDFFRVA